MVLEVPGCTYLAQTENFCACVFLHEKGKGHARHGVRACNAAGLCAVLLSFIEGYMYVEIGMYGERKVRLNPIRYIALVE